MTKTQDDMASSPPGSGRAALAGRPERGGRRAWVLEAAHTTPEAACGRRLPLLNRGGESSNAQWGVRDRRPDNFRPGRVGSLILLWVMVLPSGRFLLAQKDSVQLKASANPSAITIGDIVQFDLEVTRPESIKIALPAVGPTLNDWVVRNATHLPSKKVAPGTVAETLQLQLTVYKTGDLEIPSLNVEVVNSRGEKELRISQPIRIKVQSVLDGEQLKEIKGQAEISPDYKPFLFLLAALAALALIAYKVVRFLRQRKTPSAATPEGTRSAAEIARQAIQDLLAKRLIEAGYIKEFYLELSEILKRYLGSKLGIISLERTTEEFTGDLKSAAIPFEEYGQIKEFLMDCDLVKFAKYKPSADEIQRIVERSSEIIHSAENGTGEPVPLEVSNRDRY